MPLQGFPKYKNFNAYFLAFLLLIMHSYCAFKTMQISNNVRLRTTKQKNLSIFMVTSVKNLLLY